MNIPIRTPKLVGTSRAAAGDGFIHASKNERTRYNHSPIVSSMAITTSSIPLPLHLCNHLIRYLSPIAPLHQRLMTSVMTSVQRRDWNLTGCNGIPGSVPEQRGGVAEVRSTCGIELLCSCLTKDRKPRYFNKWLCQRRCRRQQWR